MSVAPPGGQDRIMIYGPKSDGTYIIEFRMADGESLAISVPAGETRVLKHFRRACLTGWSCRTFREAKTAPAFEFGFIASLAHPGGNVTGFTNSHWTIPANARVGCAVHCGGADHPVHDVAETELAVEPAVAGSAGFCFVRHAIR